MNKKLLYGIIFIVLCSLIYAYTLTTFSDGITTKNISFTTVNSSLYRNLSFPNWAYVIKAEIDLKGVRLLQLYEYNETLTGGNEYVSNDTWVGQVFSPGHTGTNESFDVEYVSFYIENILTNPNRTVVALVEINISDYKPTGNDLENVTIENISDVVIVDGWCS